MKIIIFPVFSWRMYLISRNYELSRKWRVPSSTFFIPIVIFSYIFVFIFISLPYLTVKVPYYHKEDAWWPSDSRRLLSHGTCVRTSTKAWNFNLENNEAVWQQLKMTHHQALTIAEALAGILKDYNWFSHSNKLLTLH